MKVTDYFAQAGDKTLVSFEILPPLKGGGMSDVFQMLDPLMEFNPPFIDVTYHREEYVYQMKPDGYYEKSSIRKRPGTVGICASIMHHYGVDAVPHLICGGFSREDTENALIDLNFLNIHNVLVLRGDAMQFESVFKPHASGHKYAVDLVRQVADMNRGVYLDENIENGYRTEFCIGVAGYPEKHFEAPNMKTDLCYTKAKIDAGASYIVTQMFFNNAAYFRYVDECRANGIDVPVVPGLKPLTKRYQINSIPRKFFVDMPEELISEVEKAKTNEAVREVGIEWCIQQSRELVQRGVPCLHYYTMGDSDTIKRIVSAVL